MKFTPASTREIIYTGIASFLPLIGQIIIATRPRLSGGGKLRASIYSILIWILLAGVAPIDNSVSKDLISSSEYGEISGRKVSVKNYSIHQNLASENTFADPLQGRIILVPARFMNTSNESGNFAFSNFTLIDTQGREYDEITDFTYTMWRDENGYEQRSEDFYPGEGRADVLAFRVAPSATPAYVEWKGLKFELN